MAEPCPETAPGPVTAAFAVVICTHNRSASLVNTLQSLWDCGYHGSGPVDIVVVANACRDDTLDTLAAFRTGHPDPALRLSWIVEPTPGKSHALNAALSQTGHGALCFIDDDQIVKSGFLDALAAGLAAHPEQDLFCGYIWPAWDGSEPGWVHAPAPHAIPIRPFPEYDLGAAPLSIQLADRLPSGGNITVRRRVFDKVGGFSTRLGPTGHNLEGGEDHDFIVRALEAGFRLIYLPDVRQLHTIDHSRMATGYTLKKSYLRSRSNFLVKMGNQGPRPYMLRKIMENGVKSLLYSWSPNRRFFHWVRLAASLGELSGAVHVRRTARANPLRPGVETPGWPLGLLIIALLVTAFGLLGLAQPWQPLAYLAPPLAVSTLAGLALLARSIATFTRTGPNLRDEILRHYSGYTFLALLRLTLWAWVLFLLMAGLGSLLYGGVAVARGQTPGPLGLTLASITGIVWILGLQFCRQLLYLPASICASLNVLPSRLYGLWRRMSPALLQGLTLGSLGAWLAVLVWASGYLLAENHLHEFMVLLGIAGVYAAIAAWALSWKTPSSGGKGSRTSDLPNIILVGSDTLRADRLGSLGHPRGLTPNLDALAARGSLFSQCYVPCARTAPSLVSLLTGLWPHHHGVRDNFVADAATALQVPDLASLLRQQGYATAAVSDWCGGDLKKFSFGFDYLDMPDDQWNIKYLIRQGPKDLRLMLSLFTHNRFGKVFLPELYYLAGVPMTTEVGRQGQAVLDALAQGDKPFLLQLFHSTTHPPFGVEYPYYTRLADPAYTGESKFVMSRLTEPFEIIRRQGQPKEEFDLDQILDLYDSCVMRFDDEVGALMAQLKLLGLADNTIVVVYSDHGMEFFEHNTWGQGNSAIGDFSPRVPLIIADPGLPPQRCDGVVRSIDIMPTLLERVGIPAPAHLDGCSLMPALRGDPAPPLAAFNETGIWIADIPGLPAQHLHYPDLLELLEVPDRKTGTLAIKPEYQDITILAKDRMVRQGRWKLVYQPLEDGYLLQLFDTATDPNCLQDMSQQLPQRTAELWQLLKAWMTQDPLMAQALDKNGTRDCPPCP